MTLAEDVYVPKVFVPDQTQLTTTSTKSTSPVVATKPDEPEIQVLKTEDWQNQQQLQVVRFALEGRIQELRKLLNDVPVDVNYTSPDSGSTSRGLTPLMAASQFGYIAIVRLLLEKGADVGYVSPMTGETALHLATRSGHTVVLRELIHHGANVHVQGKKGSGQTALLMAAEYGYVDTAKLLLEKGSSVNFRDESGYTALHWAAREGHLEMVRLLLKRGAAVNPQDRKSCTPLYLAVKHGRHDVSMLLLDHKAKVYIHETTNGMTALQEAARGDAQIMDMLQKLLSTGAFVDVPTKTEDTT